MFVKMLKRIYHLLLYKHICLYRGKKIVKRYCVDDNRYYIITSHGLGDVVWMCVYLKGFLDANNIEEKSVVIITEEKLSKIIKCFYPEYVFDFVSKKELISMQQYLSEKEHEDNIKLAVFPLVRVNNIGIIEFELLSHVGADMDMLYRVGCFSLKRGVETFPIINNGSTSVGRIILVPYVNSRNIIPIAVWEKIANICKKYNKEVYTNIGLEEKCISGTKALNIGLNEIAEFINEKDLVIGGRCGLIDWLFITKKNMIVLHSILRNADNKVKESRNNFAYWESFEELEQSVFGTNKNRFLKDIRLLVDDCNTDLTIVDKLIEEFFEE